MKMEILIIGPGNIMSEIPFEYRAIRDQLEYILDHGDAGCRYAAASIAGIILKEYSREMFEKFRSKESNSSVLAVLDSYLNED